MLNMSLTKSDIKVEIRSQKQKYPHCLFFELENAEDETLDIDNYSDALLVYRMFDPTSDPNDTEGILITRATMFANIRRLQPDYNPELIEQLIWNFRGVVVNPLIKFVKGY